MDPIPFLQHLYGQFPDRSESRFYFHRVEKALQKEFQLTHTFFLTLEKEGLRTTNKEKQLWVRAKDPAFRHQEKTGKPWFPAAGSKPKESGFWPVLAGGRWAACFALGAKLNGKKLSDGEKRLMELLADRTGLFLEEQRLWSHLENSNRQSALGFMSAAMVHEIRNPLTALNTLVQLLPRKKHDERFMESFQKLMLQEIARLSRMTETFLDFSKSDSEHSALVDLSSVIERVVQLLGPLFVSKKVQLKVANPPGLLLKGDEYQMESLVINLLQNAFQSVAPQGWVEISAAPVRRSSQGPGPWIELSVRDNGAGISPENLNRIFDPFFSTRGGGTGLGLAICQKVVQNHRGVLRVKSPSQKGTLFTLLFPAIFKS